MPTDSFPPLVLMYVQSISLFAAKGLPSCYIQVTRRLPFSKTETRESPCQAEARVGPKNLNCAIETLRAPAGRSRRAPRCDGSALAQPSPAQSAGRDEVCDRLNQLDLVTSI